MTLNRHLANTLCHYSILSYKSDRSLLRACVHVCVVNERAQCVFCSILSVFLAGPLKCYAAHVRAGKPDEQNKSRALSALHRRIPPLERFKKQTVRQAGPCACWEGKVVTGRAHS